MSWESILFITTLVLSALFSGSETAYVSANRLKLHLQSRKKQEIDLESLLLSDSQIFLTTTLVGNNIVMVACSSLAVLVFSKFVPNSIVILVTTLFLLFFGEILPKSFAQNIPNKAVQFTPRFLKFCYIVFYPIIYVANLFSRNMVRLLGGQKDDVKLFFKKRDLPILIRKYISQDTLDFDDRVLISRAVRIGEKRVSDIMLPRTDMIAVSNKESITNIKELFYETGLSRLPVYEGSIDHIIGFYYVLDFLTARDQESLALRPVLFLPESMRVFQILKKLRAYKTSIAVAIDEHGGTAGLVTFEDIVEKLFGSILDEFDKEKKLVFKLDENTFFIDARTKIDELSEKYQLQFPEGDYVTIGGFVETYLGYIPKTGYLLRLHNYTIKILSADATKINKIIISKHPVI